MTDRPPLLWWLGALALALAASTPDTVGTPAYSPDPMTYKEPNR